MSGVDLGAFPHRIPLDDGGAICFQTPPRLVLIGDAERKFSFFGATPVVVTRLAGQFGAMFFLDRLLTLAGQPGLNLPWPS